MGYPAYHSHLAEVRSTSEAEERPTLLVWVHVCISSLYVCMYIYIHTLLQITELHTYIHTYMHTYIPTYVRFLLLVVALATFVVVRTFATMSILWS